MKNIIPFTYLQDKTLKGGSFLFCIFLLSSFSLHSQETEEKELYFYHISIPNFDSFEITKKEDGSLSIFSLESLEENEIIKQHKVYEFQPAFPNTLKENLKIVYRITTDSPSLVFKLEKLKPEKYQKIGEYFPPKVSYYPNDYGTTSPVENLGAPYPLTGLDLINAPSAWGITKGNKKVVIGISDARVDSTNIDLQGRVSKYLKYFDVTTGTVCTHGTGIAGIIGAIHDNAFGMPGICPDCDIITNGYGQFDFIQELVEAGAKVINVSWVLCGFGQYHQNIQERINEYYEEGILLVAGAGNAKKCNPYLADGSSSYGYPASFKNVISVTTVFADCDYPEDCMEDHEYFGTVVNDMKDRHLKSHILQNGKLAGVNGQWSMQHNLAVDITAPTNSFLLGRAGCGREDEQYGGASSTSTAVVTGVIGLIWSANYCLGSAEVESIMKLTAADIESLPGNKPYKMLLGAGRIDAYASVKMAHQMQLQKGNVEVTGRDFYRFDFTLKSAPYRIQVHNQTFRDSSTVDFSARKQIHLKPGTHLKPDKTGFIKLKINPALPTDECFPKPVVPKPKVVKDSIPVSFRFQEPYTIINNPAIQGIKISPVEAYAENNYEVLILKGKEIVFKKNYTKMEVASISLEEIKNELVTINVTGKIYKMSKNIRINIP